MFDGMLTIGGAARRLGLSRERIVQLERAGKIRTLRTPLGRLLDAEEVERVLRERQMRAAGGDDSTPGGRD